MGNLHPVSIMRFYTSRTVIFLFYCLFIASTMGTSVSGQEKSSTIRIGLAVKQPRVVLQSTVPVEISSVGRQHSVLLDAETALRFSISEDSVLVHDAQENLLLQCPARTRLYITPRPLPADTPAEAPIPLIRLLGPSRHYDGKADRPYRGVFELIPGADGFTVVNLVEMEWYLMGVVSSEMSPTYPREALKAQAIAARTYAQKNLGRMAEKGFDLDDTAACQVYGGFFCEDPRTNQAVLDTAFQVITYQGKLIDAVYSSTCGGITESAEQAWGRKVPYLRSVSDAPPGQDDAFPRPKNEVEWGEYFKTARAWNCLQPVHAKVEAFRWVKLVTHDELVAALPANYQVGMINAMTPLKRGDSGRITSLRLEGSMRSVVIEKELTIRSALGKLRSSAFIVDIYRDERGKPVVFAFWGAGWGHGLGMCQVGAVGLAEHGWDCEQILKHYYHGSRLAK